MPANRLELEIQQLQDEIAILTRRRSESSTQRIIALFGFLIGIFLLLTPFSWLGYLLLAAGVLAFITNLIKTNNLDADIQAHYNLIHRKRQDILARDDPPLK